MRKVFDVVMKILTLLCAALFVSTAAIALVFFNVERRLFNAQFYLRALESQDFYERLPAIAAETLTASGGFNPCEENPVLCASEGRPQEVQGCLEAALGAEAYRELLKNQRTPTSDELANIQPCLDQYPTAETGEPTGGPPDYLKSLSTENWEAVIRAILPPDMLRSLTEKALNSIFAVLNGQADSATLSLADFKAHISGPAGTQAVMEMIRAQPPCAFEQIAEMTVSGLAGEPKLIFCNPSDEALAVLQPIIRSTLQSAAAGIPDTATLIRADDPNLQNPLQALRALRAILRFSPLIPMGFLFLITLFAVRDAKSWLLWWGIPLLLVGLIGFVVGAVIGPLTHWAFANFLAPRLPSVLPEAMRELMRGLIASVLSGLSKPIGIQSGALALTGLILVVVATRLKPLLLPTLILLLAALACGSPSPTVVLTSRSAIPTPANRLASIPAEAVKITPETDAYPVRSETAEYADPVSLLYPVNTAGAEDSAFILPDGKTLYVWFTPDTRVPAEKQLLDGVTGIYIFRQTNGIWSEAERVTLQDPGKLALDGCEFILGNVMWFCSAREGYNGIQWFTAEFQNGKWRNWKSANFNPEYEVGELHITADGKELYFHSPRAGGLGGLDIWVSQNVDGEWQEPVNLAVVNSPQSEGWPFITQDGLELWFTRSSGAPELWRSKKVNGKWTEPQKMFGPFAGEASLDKEGNVYFTHHFFRDNVMLEADIYIAIKYRAIP